MESSVWFTVFQCVSVVLFYPNLQIAFEGDGLSLNTQTWFQLFDNIAHFTDNFLLSSQLLLWFTVNSTFAEIAGEHLGLLVCFAHTSLSSIPIRKAVAIFRVYLFQILLEFAISKDLVARFKFLCFHITCSKRKTKENKTLPHQFNFIVTFIMLGVLLRFPK